MHLSPVYHHPLLSRGYTGVQNLHILSFEDYHKISLITWDQLFSLQWQPMRLPAFPGLPGRGLHAYGNLCQCESPNYCLQLYVFCVWVRSFSHTPISHLRLLVFSLCLTVVAGGAGRLPSVPYFEALLCDRARKLPAVKHYRQSSRPLEPRLCCETVSNCSVSAYSRVRLCGFRVSRHFGKLFARIP